MEIRRYLGLLKKWGWLMLLIAGLAAAGSYFYSQTLPSTYRAEAILLVGQEQQNADPTITDIYVSNNVAQAYALLVNQPAILEATAREVKWEGTWQSLYFNVSATAPTGGQTIHIAATARTPGQAQEIANELARQVILQSPISRQQQALDAQREFVTQQQALLQSQIAAAQKTLFDMNQQAALETDPAKLDALDERVTNLQTKIDNWQRTYLQMGTLLNSSSGRFLTLIAPAGLPGAPISPNIQQNVMLAALAGLGLAIGLVLLLEYLDDTIKSAEDVQRVLNITTLGTIARISPLRKPADALIALRHPRSPVAEDYRSLRTNLRYAGIENPGGALLVTSAGPSEGKTTTAANLAIAMAQSGKRVLLVDADLRRPSLHHLFGLSNQMGLASLFLDEPPMLDAALHTTEVPGLRLVTAGDPPPNPAELLDSRRMNQVLTELRAQADMVILDTPPLLVVSDASILASRCSGAVLVVDSGRTRTQAAERVMENLKRSQVQVLGVVLNRLTGRRGGYYHHYYYYGSSNGRKASARAPARSKPEQI